jgi:UPF0288 family protein (methanogenesis marker protein 3)
MSLRTTIQEIHIRDQSLSALDADRDEFLRRWIIDLKELYGQIESALLPFKNDGLLSFNETTAEISGDEDALGTYEAPVLRIDIASRHIFASPVARLTSGGEGRVDLYRHDRLSSSDRVSIVRRVDESGTLVWKIESKDAAAADPLVKWRSDLSLIAGRTKNYEFLSPHSLERALDYLLHL